MAESEMSPKSEDIMKAFGSMRDQTRILQDIDLTAPSLSEEEVEESIQYTAALLLTRPDSP